MNNHSPRQERVLKIFTPVRCINRDQLLRYHRGNMTPVEKHLVEQHIIDCDLCHDALHIMSNPQLHEQYHLLSNELSQFIRREFAPPPKPDKALQQRQVNQYKTTESLLSYFWAIMFVAIGGGSIFLLQQHLKNRPALAALPSRASGALIIPAASGTPSAAIDPNYNEGQPPGGQATQTGEKPLVIHTQYNSIARDTINGTTTTGGTGAGTAIPQAKLLTKKDSAAAALKKKPLKDSAVKSAMDTNSGTTPAQKEEKKPEAKDQRLLAENDENKKEEKEKEKTGKTEKAGNTDNTEKTNSANSSNTAGTTGTNPNSGNKSKEEPQTSGDESLFRAAMQYQQQGNLNEAANQFKKLSGNEKYSERAKYQLAMIYKSKGQNGKARRLFKEIIRMEGNMKTMAQTQLNTIN